MNARYLAAPALIVSALACNVLAASPTAMPVPPPAPTATPPPTATPEPTATPTAAPPDYIPPGCEAAPLVTIPAATAQAQPTPDIAANPELSTSTQLAVFDEAAGIIEQNYVDPEFNGQDWPAIWARYRAEVEAGMDTGTFYTQMQAMISELGDEHSYFDSPLQVAQEEAFRAGNIDYVGIGVFVLPLLDRDRATILAVFPDSPAEHAGLLPHDSLLAVDGLPLVADGVSYPYLLRGPECSALVLTVQSPGEEPRDVMILRHRITSPLPLDARLMPTADGSRIGYVFLPTFGDLTLPDRVAEALAAWGPLDGLILDNRMNGGGSSDVLEPMLAFFTSGTLGTFESRAGSRSLTLAANPIHNSQGVPLVVLVGQDTVSYGEVFAGVLQDSGRAAVVGQTTLGNVETLHGYTLQDGSQLWIAQERFVPAVSGADWEATGIVPDVEAFADWETFTFQDDPALAAALALLGH